MGDRELRVLRVALVAAAASLAVPARAQDDLPMRAMKDELARSTSELKLDQMDRPYFIAYRMDDFDSVAVSAMLGSATSVRPARWRIVGVELRVGDYAFDNSNFFSTRSFGAGGPQAIAGAATGPIDDDYRQIRRQLWLTTDSQYKKAVQDLTAKRAAVAATRRGDDLPDFSRAPPLSDVAARARTRLAPEELEALVREISAVFREFPQLQGSSVEASQNDVYTRYVNSERTSFTRSTSRVALRIHAEALAPSGLPLDDSVVIHGRSMEDLPARAALLARARELASRLVALRSAPSFDRYSGPVLFEGAAAAEVVAQHLAPALLALRQPQSDDARFDAIFRTASTHLGGGAFADRIGGRVLPDHLTIVDRPIAGDHGGSPLLGGQRIDDDGVLARETRLVERGVLKTLLSTRVPVRGVAESTGSRRGGGPAPSNLFVTCERAVSAKQLRTELARRVRERGLAYGIVVRHVGGSSLGRLAALVGRGGPGTNALAEVYRVYPDGREELLQGVELADLSPASFKDVVTAGDMPTVFSDVFVGGMGQLFPFASFNGTFAPVTSFVVPSLLFDDLTLVKTRGSFPPPPVTPSPLATR